MNALLILLVLCTAMLRAQDGRAALPSDPVHLARKASTALLDDLRSALMRHMSRGGPAAAITVCADSAQALTQTVGRTHDLTIRRVSTRWRNPLNAPDSFETAALARFDTLSRAGMVTDTTECITTTRAGGATVTRFLKPILAQPVCLSCHGIPSSIKSNVAENLRNRYPEDRATGYKAGDLRGAVSVTITRR